MKGEGKAYSPMESRLNYTLSLHEVIDWLVLNWFALVQNHYDKFDSPFVRHRWHRKGGTVDNFLAINNVSVHSKVIAGQDWPIENGPSYGFRHCGFFTHNQYFFEEVDLGLLVKTPTDAKKAKKLTAALSYEKTFTIITQSGSTAIRFSISNFTSASISVPKKWAK
jgi:hypothetical protein